MKALHISTASALLIAAASQAHAQRSVFSIDWQSATIGVGASGGGGPIDPGDMLSPAAGLTQLGPLAIPAVALQSGPGGLGLMPCIATSGAPPCPTEVDAFSFGQDDVITPVGVRPGQLHFSVDTFGMGAGPIIPNVQSEAMFGDAAADVMLNTRMLPGGPLPPGPSLGHRGLMDGDGLYSGSGYTYPGLGLREPSVPGGGPFNPGDNLDALDTQPPGPSVPGFQYFSLDSPIVDPLTGIPGVGSANIHGFMGADVLKSGFTLVAPAIYAPAPALGLNAVPGLLDDLDALILTDNGDGIYQPSMVPYDWMGGATDMLLFSVRRGSGVIGMPDSIFGIPIEEGDILTAPLPGFMGGVSPFPGLFIAAENFGLATMRSGLTMGAPADDLSAMDSYSMLIKDCDGDGIEDVLAIAQSITPDVNMNGIPDPCELSFPCATLPNSTSFPTMMVGTPTAAPGAGLHLEASNGPPGQFGYFLVGTGLASPGLSVGSGNLCLATTFPNAIGRYNLPSTAMNSVGQFSAAGILVNLVGTSTVGTGFDVPNALPLPIGGTILPGSTYHFQLWHRDIPSTSNFSNTVTWTF